MAKNEKVVLIKEETFKKLKEISEKRGLTIREVAMDDKHEDFNEIIDVFYSALPTYYRWMMTKPKFREFFINNREMMLTRAGY